MDWQTHIAAGIVIFTLTVFVVRIIRPPKPGGCGHDCGCGGKSR